jgi:hypothetical protein
VQQLRVMHIRELLNGLDFENDLAAHNEIQALVTYRFTSVRN